MITSGLGRHRRASVMRGAAALALWPPNADRHVALNALIDALATETREHDDRRQIEVEDWRSWLATNQSRALREIEPAGLHDAPLCVETSVLGERYGLIGGDLEYPDLHYRLWADAIDRTLQVSEDPGLARARELLLCTARISDHLVRVAELGGYRWPDHGLSLKLRAPDAAEYERLCHAVTIPLENLELSESALGEIVRREREIHWRPLVLEDETLLVADPWRLTLSGLVQAVAALTRSPELRTVKEHLRAAALRTALQAATDMHWTVSDLDDRSFIAEADTGCRILVAVEVCAPDGDAQEVALEDMEDLTASYRDTRERAEQRPVQHGLLAVIGDGRAITASPDSGILNLGEAPTVWPTGLGDLRLLGDALRADPLALPVALERAPPAPWPANLDLVDLAGAVRRDEEPYPHRENAPMDGTEHMHMRARVASGRHPARRDRNDRWEEVVRWSGSPDPRLFCVEGTDALELVTRAPGVYLWVSPAADAASRYHLDGCLATMLASWLGRVFERITNGGPRALYAQFEIELDDGLGAALAVATMAGRYRLIVGGGLIDAACRGDNEADRMILGAALYCLGFREDRLVDEILPHGRGTYMIWPDPDLRANPPTLEPPPLLTPRDRANVERMLAASVLPEGHEGAIIIGDGVKEALYDLVERLEETIGAGLETLEHSSVLELIRLHERAARQSEAEEISLPARHAIAAGHTEAPHFGPRESVGARNVALRSLIERAAARPPGGENAMSMRIAGWLRAAVELQVKLGGALDFAAGGGVRLELAVHHEHGIAVRVDGRLPRAGEHRNEQVELTAPDLMAQEHRDWWTTSGTPASEPAPALNQPIEMEDRYWAELDRRTGEEWGIGLEELTRMLGCLNALAEESKDGVGVCARDTLLEALRERSAISISALSAGLARLTLGPATDYNATDGPHAPWRAFRERTYIRRPVVALDDETVAWSATQVAISARYLYMLINAGRLQDTPPVMKAVGTISQRNDQAFEMSVMDRMHRSGWQARARLKKVGGMKLERTPGEPIGDIDVLAWNKQRREVWLLECKRIAPGLNPATSTRESKMLAKTVGHHEERVAWVRTHPGRLARELGVQEAGNWTVTGAIVLDQPLLGAELLRTGLPIWTMRELPGRLQA